MRRTGKDAIKKRIIIKTELSVIKNWKLCFLFALI